MEITVTGFNAGNMGTNPLISWFGTVTYPITLFDATVYSIGFDPDSASTEYFLVYSAEHNSITVVSKIYNPNPAILPITDTPYGNLPISGSQATYLDNSTGETFWFTFAPSAPTNPPYNITVTLSGTSATLAWETPIGTPGGDVTQYQINVADASGGSFIVVVPDALSYTFNTLVLGQTYTFSVRAETTGGQGPFGSITKTLAPTLLGVYNVNNGTSPRRILAVLNDVSDGKIDVYDASNNAIVASNIAFNTSFGPTTREVIYYVLNTNVAGTVNDFYFKRSTGDYAGIASNTVAVQAGINNVPFIQSLTNLRVDGYGPYTFVHDASQEAIDILSAELPFKLNVRSADGSAFEIVTPVFFGSMFFFTASSVSTFSMYNPVTYKSSPWRGSVANNSPSILNITQTSNSIAVDVSYNYAYPGQTVGNITVQLATNDTFTQNVQSILVTPGNTTATFTGLTSGTLYYIRARADAGILGENFSATVIKPTLIANAPDNIVATAGNATLTATWAPPIGLTSADITKYTVSISPAPSSGPSSYDVSGTVTSQVFNNLLNDTTYTVSVSAWNAAGQGPVGTAGGTPTAPGGGSGGPILPPGGGGGVVPCFFGNAPVLTKSGYRRMDSLRAGDRVMTPEGAEATVERVKVTQCTAGPQTNPYVIPRGRFGAERRVLISPNHRVVTDSGLIEARHLGLEQEDRQGALTYYNLELVGQAHMVVGGVAVESLGPVKRMVMTMDQFKAALQQKYGGINAGVLANIQRTCRFLADGRVEVPVLPKLSQQNKQ